MPRTPAKPVSEKPTAGTEASPKVRKPSSAYRHPVNQQLLEHAPLGARIADRVTGFMGSWKFIVIQTVIVLIWITGNIYLLFHFDPFPFILLNLAFSTQAAYAAPLILLAGNRAAIRDRLTLEHAAAASDIGDEQNERLLKGNTEILKVVEGLEQSILELEKRIMARLGDSVSDKTDGGKPGSSTGEKPSGSDSKSSGSHS